MMEKCVPSLLKFVPNSSQICAKPASKVSHILCDLLTSKFPPQQRRIKAPVPVQLPNHPLAATFPSLVVDPKPQKLTRTVEQTPGDLIAQISMIARGNLCLPLSPPRLRWLNSSKERWRVAINSESLNCHKKLSTTQAGGGATIRRGVVVTAITLKFPILEEGKAKWRFVVV